MTDRRKLRHIENTLDKAIASSIQDDSIQSHKDFRRWRCVLLWSCRRHRSFFLFELGAVKLLNSSLTWHSRRWRS
ncbi:MAG: hypothetical protein ACYTX0_25320 [Nostoc sp.]